MRLAERSAPLGCFGAPLQRTPFAAAVRLTEERRAPRRLRGLWIKDYASEIRGNS